MCTVLPEAIVRVSTGRIVFFFLSLSLSQTGRRYISNNVTSGVGDKMLGILINRIGIRFGRSRTFLMGINQFLLKRLLQGLMLVIYWIFVHFVGA